MNKGADALSRRYLLLSILETKVLGFEVIKGMYANDEDLKEIFVKSSSHHTVHFMFKRDSFLREPGYAYPSVSLESSLSRNSIVVLLPATLELRRLVPCSRNTTIGLECLRMWITLSKGAQLVK